MGVSLCGLISSSNEEALQQTLRRARHHGFAFFPACLRCYKTRTRRKSMWKGKGMERSIPPPHFLPDEFLTRLVTELDEDTVTAIGLDLLPCAYCWHCCLPTSAARTRPGNALSLQKDSSPSQALSICRALEGHRANAPNGRAHLL